MFVFYVDYCIPFLLEMKNMLERMLSIYVKYYFHKMYIFFVFNIIVFTGSGFSLGDWYTYADKTYNCTKFAPSRRWGGACTIGRGGRVVKKKNWHCFFLIFSSPHCASHHPMTKICISPPGPSYAPLVQLVHSTGKEVLHDGGGGGIGAGWARAGYTIGKAPIYYFQKTFFKYFSCRFYKKIFKS